MINKKQTPMLKFLYWLQPKLSNPVVAVAAFPLTYAVCMWLITDKEWGEYMTDIETWVKIKVRS